MSKMPTVATITMETIETMIEVVNVNSLIPLEQDCRIVAELRDTLIADGVIKRESWGDCTFSDFYAERDENEQDADSAD